MKRTEKIYNEAFNYIFDILEEDTNIFSESKIDRSKINIFYENFMKSFKSDWLTLSDTKLNHLCQASVLHEVALPILVRVQLHEGRDLETDSLLELSLDSIEKKFKLLNESFVGIVGITAGIIALFKFLLPPAIESFTSNIVDYMAAAIKTINGIALGPTVPFSELNRKEIRELDSPKKFEAIIRQCTGLTDFNPNGWKAAGIIRLLNSNKIFEYRKCLLSKLIDLYSDLLRALLATLRAKQMIEEMEKMASMNSLSMNTFFQAAIRSVKGDEEAFYFISTLNDIQDAFRKMIQHLRKEGGMWKKLAEDLNRQFNKTVENVVKEADSYVKEEREKQEELEKEEMERSGVNSQADFSKSSPRDSEKTPYRMFPRYQRERQAPKTDSGFESGRFGSYRYNRREQNRDYIKSKEDAR